MTAKKHQRFTLAAPKATREARHYRSRLQRAAKRARQQGLNMEADPMAYREAILKEMLS